MSDRRRLEARLLAHAVYRSELRNYTSSSVGRGSPNTLPSSAKDFSESESGYARRVSEDDSEVVRRAFLNPSISSELQSSDSGTDKIQLNPDLLSFFRQRFAEQDAFYHAVRPDKTSQLTTSSSATDSANPSIHTIFCRRSEGVKALHRDLCLMKAFVSELHDLGKFRNASESEAEAGSSNSSQASVHQVLSLMTDEDVDMVFGGKSFSLGKTASETREEMSRVHDNLMQSMSLTPTPSDGFLNTLPPPDSPTTTPLQHSRRIPLAAPSLTYFFFNRLQKFHLTQHRETQAIQRLKFDIQNRKKRIARIDAYLNGPWGITHDHIQKKLLPVFNKQYKECVALYKDLKEGEEVVNELLATGSLEASYTALQGDILDSAWTSVPSAMGILGNKKRRVKLEPMRELGGEGDPFSLEMCQHYCDTGGRGLESEENPFKKAEQDRAQGNSSSGTESSESSNAAAASRLPDVCRGISWNPATGGCRLWRSSCELQPEPFDMPESCVQRAERWKKEREEKKE